MRLIESTIHFEVEGVVHEFKVIHDLPETSGLSIQDAFDSWLYRTNDYSPESLCGYIKSKDPEAFVLTEEQYKKLTQ